MYECMPHSKILWLSVLYACSMDTPPGTKMRVKGIVEVANGFMLLTKFSVEILGGRVEGLLRKWHTTKASSSRKLNL